MTNIHTLTTAHGIGDTIFIINGLDILAARVTEIHARFTTTENEISYRVRTEAGEMDFYEEETYSGHQAAADWLIARIREKAELAAALGA